MLNNKKKQKINFAKDKYCAITKEFIAEKAEKWGVTMRKAETRILNELANEQLNKNKQNNANA